MLKRYYPCCSALTRYVPTTEGQTAGPQWSCAQIPLCTWTKQPLTSSVPRGCLGCVLEPCWCHPWEQELLRLWDKPWAPRRCWQGWLVLMRGRCLSSSCHFIFLLCLSTPLSCLSLRSSKSSPCDKWSGRMFVLGLKFEPLCFQTAILKKKKEKRGRIEKLFNFYYLLSPEQCFFVMFFSPCSFPAPS